MTPWPQRQGGSALAGRLLFDFWANLPYTTVLCNHHHLAVLACALRGRGELGGERIRA